MTIRTFDPVAFECVARKAALQCKWGELARKAKALGLTDADIIDAALDFTGELQQLAANSDRGA